MIAAWGTHGAFLDRGAVVEAELRRIGKPLATLGLSLSHLPPFLLTGLALVIGSVPAWSRVRQWKMPLPTLALGVYGLFGFHFLLFIALRLAPPVEANLVNYLWPLLIVVMGAMVMLIVLAVMLPIIQLNQLVR